MRSKSEGSKGKREAIEEGVEASGREWWNRSKHRNCGTLIVLWHTIRKKNIELDLKKEERFYLKHVSLSQ